MTLKIGIIGCGGIANGKHMPSLKAVEEGEMVAFCDIIEERALKAKEEFGTDDAKVYTDYKEMLKDPTIDVIHVCTPNSSHSVISVRQWKLINMLCVKNQWRKQRLKLKPCWKLLKKLEKN